MTIEEMTLSDLLPRVFVNEKIPASDVWLSKLTLKRGGRYRIEASSGGGKSSLCAYIFGSRDDYEGTLLFNGRNVREFDIAMWQRLRRENLAYLPQELGLFPELTALENIRLKNDITGSADESRIIEWLDRLGILSRKDYPVGRMSVGQQQRVAIIRSICQPFDFILLDEPVSHLDADNNRIAAEIIDSEARRQGAAIISTSVGNAIEIEGMEVLKL